VAPALLSPAFRLKGRFAIYWPCRWKLTFGQHREFRIRDKGGRLTMGFGGNTSKTE
jgi:hypothetical protein